MALFTKLSESAGLVSGMAARLDVDLADRVATAPVQAAPRYADMVARCAQCREHAACARLQEANPMLDAAPDYCVNRHVFAAASGTRR